MSWSDRLRALMGLAHLGQRMNRDDRFSKRRWNLLHEVSEKWMVPFRDRPTKKRPSRRKP